MSYVLAFLLTLNNMFAELHSHQMPSPKSKHISYIIKLYFVFIYIFLLYESSVAFNTSHKIDRLHL